MREYVGIDLGTTNCAICSFDGTDVNIYKSPEQQEVTPSAIYIDRRGNKYIGARAYDRASKNPDSAATLFKRLMGTSTPIKLSDVGLTTTPEECSADMLRVLYGYLPDRIRDDRESGTVITVPAAFNQMQKDATMNAALSAEIGPCVLMQEPVAAVMSVMRKRRSDGHFVVFDLGGGTLDVAIAQNISGHVNLLAHGGIAMCGGRDFDRRIWDVVIRPWLISNFNLPSNFSADLKHKSLVRMATWAGEKAKIRLSNYGDTVISDPDFDGMGFRDDSGREIFLDVPLTVSLFDSLIADELKRAVTATREIIDKTSLSPFDIERIVFVGGPTQYRPLRDRIASELGIAPSTDVNPMTAVAEGAALYAESVDWSVNGRSRKESRGQLIGGEDLPISFNYAARTPQETARIGIKLLGPVPDGCTFQVESMETGWSSGRMGLADGLSSEVTLVRTGDNVFRVLVFDSQGRALSFPNSLITIAKTAATVDAIPSSSSIAIEALDKIGGNSVPVYIVRQGQQLPAAGQVRFKAAESLRAGGPGTIQLKLWEGEIDSPLSDNRFIGALAIVGSDFDEGMIAAGDDVVCNYEVSDSGNIILEATVDSIGGTFRQGNFYSRRSGEIDLTDARKLIAEDARSLLDRARDVASRVQNPSLNLMLNNLSSLTVSSASDGDPESAKKAIDEILEAKMLLAKVRTENRKEIRQLDLDKWLTFFNEHIKRFASAAEITVVETTVRSAQRSIDENRSDFESQLDELRNRAFAVMWRQDWFVVDRFSDLADSVHLFPDRKHHASLVGSGKKALSADDIDTLRRVVFELDSVRLGTGDQDRMLGTTNIVRSQ